MVSRIFDLLDKNLLVSFCRLDDHEDDEQMNIPLICLFLLADLLYKYTINRKLISTFLTKSTASELFDMTI